MPHKPADSLRAPLPGQRDDPVLLSHDQLIDELRGLCASKHSGTMFIITAENHAAQFVLREGTIAGLTYRLLRGVAALPSMTAFRAGRYRFQTETVDHTDPELPATAELLALLVAERTEAVQPQAKPATDPPQAPAALRLLIEHELAEFLGPIAALICQEHLTRAGGLDSPSDLVRLVETLADEIEDPAKAAAFKHQVLSKAQRAG
ncbi:MAG TPA: hypothetical protein VKJ67_09925 [Methylomirabilota bacterium]|nr:hypothetical protein [Methylomirabilota bacterium]